MTSYKCIEDFNAEGEGELSVKFGQVIKISDVEEDWGLAKTTTGEEGWVPVAFFKKMKASQVTKTDPASTVTRAMADNTETVNGIDNLSKAWNDDEEKAMEKLGFGKSGNALIKNAEQKRGTDTNRAAIEKRNKENKNCNEENETARNVAQNRTQCAKCKLEIVGPGVQDADVFYHPACWTCAACMSSIGAGVFVRHEGSPYHQDCFKKKYGPGNCGSCGMEITGRFLKYKDQKYHKKCFNCDICSGSIAAGFVERGSKKLCGSCVKKNPIRTARRNVQSASGKTRKADDAESSSMGGQDSTKGKFCHGCRAKATGGKFCSECGSRY